MYNYIYTILYQYVSIDSIVVLCSIVLPILVLWIFWSGTLRQKVLQTLGDLNKRYKK